MTLPRFYHVHTLDGEHEDQKVFQMHGLEMDVTEDIADGNRTEPVKCMSITHYPIEECVVNIAMGEHHVLDARWNKLPLTIVPFRKMGERESKVSLSLRYAMSNETKQLFEYLRYSERLRHAQQVGRMQNTIEKITASRDALRTLYTEAKDYITYLELPWYRKLWLFLTSKQDF